MNGTEETRLGLRSQEWEDLLAELDQTKPEWGAASCKLELWRPWDDSGGRNGAEPDSRMEQYEARRVPQEDIVGTHEIILDAHEATHAPQEA